MKKTTALAFLLLATVSLSVAAPDPDIEIVAPWVRAVPSSMTATAAYFTIQNNTDEAIRLVGGSTEIAGTCEPMIGTREEKDGQEVMGMRTVEALEVPAKGGLVLEPGGDHLMLMQLSEVPVAGEEVEISLEFAPGDRVVSVVVPVLKDAPQP